MLKIEIDNGSGFCFGVTTAIRKAEEELARGERLYCLGDIVHNGMECERLRRLGLVTIDHEEMSRLHHVKVLLRAHGEPPSTYELARRNDIELIDATCPIVLALQERIKKGYDEMRQVGGQIVVFGKPGHAEVVGLTGQTEGTALIVSTPDDIDAIDFSRPIRLYSQTTKSREEYQQLISNIQARLPQGADFVAFDTICKRVANRAHDLEGFARSVDVLLFVSGNNSSNGHYLYEYCRKVQPRTYLIADASQLQADWFEGARSVGISGATSTPRWLMEEVKSVLSAQCSVSSDATQNMDKQLNTEQ
jgi:4-hydroxy-3-methylbut-2-enyl diphosphate reductase